MRGECVTCVKCRNTWSARDRCMIPCRSMKRFYSALSLWYFFDVSSVVPGQRKEKFESCDTMNADPTFLIISFNNVIPFQTPAPWTKEGKQLIRDLGLQIQVSQWRTLNKNGYNQKNEPTILLPSGVHHQDNLKLTQKN